MTVKLLEWLHLDISTCTSVYEQVCGSVLIRIKLVWQTNPKARGCAGYICTKSATAVTNGTDKAVRSLLKRAFWVCAGYLAVQT